MFQLSHMLKMQQHRRVPVFASFYLMYGRHPRLAVDAFLDKDDDAVKANSHADFVDKLTGTYVCL